MATPFQPTLFLNIPVSSLASALPFYRALGMTQNATFSSDDTACMVLSPAISVMLMQTYVVPPLPSHTFFNSSPFCNNLSRSSLTPPSTRFQAFLPPATQPAPAKTCSAIFCVTVQSREDVDRVVEACGEVGGTRDPTTLPEMPGGYGRSVQDGDGNLWEVAWMGGMIGC